MTINPNKYLHVRISYLDVAVPRADIEALMNILGNSFEVLNRYDPHVTYLRDEPVNFTITPMPKLGEKE